MIKTDFIKLISPSNVKLNQEYSKIIILINSVNFLSFSKKLDTNNNSKKL